MSVLLVSVVWWSFGMLLFGGVCGVVGYRLGWRDRGHSIDDRRRSVERHARRFVR